MNDGDELLASARAKLARHVPGNEAEELADLVDPTRLRPASVLLPLYEAGSEAGVLFVRRSDHLGKHAGQIAFPGGGRDRWEDDLQCALREAREEVGLDPGDVEILGALDRRPTVTGYLVSPFVGLLRRWPIDLVPDPSEVASIFTVPLERLVEPGVLRVASLEGRREIDFFDVGDDVIWGATARILREFLELVLGRPLEAGHEIPWDKVRW